MIPLQDLNPTRRRPIMLFIIIAVNVLVFLWTLTLDNFQIRRVFLEYSIVPATIVSDPFSVESFLDFVRSMFFHGGWGHLLGNMLYLWVFGDNVEDRLGPFGFTIFYLVCGFAAGIIQIISMPSSPIPLIGASGAIAGVLGYYLVTYPRARIRTLVIFIIFIRVMQIPAVLLLGFWFVIQLFNGVATSLDPDAFMSGGVAFWAHAGGFAAGAVIGLVLNAILPPVSRAGSYRDIYY